MSGSYSFGVVNNSFELFFFQGGMILQHPTLMTFIQGVGAQVWIYCRFSLIHTGSNLYRCVQIYTYMILNVIPTTHCFMHVSDWMFGLVHLLDWRQVLILVRKMLHVEVGAMWCPFKKLNVRLIYPISHKSDVTSNQKLVWWFIQFETIECFIQSETTSGLCLGSWSCWNI